MTTIPELTLDVSQQVSINASIETAYAALIRRLTVDSTTPDNRSMPLELEQWPGGRWYRNTGDKQGHLWGFVQVIKPPTLIEIHGPMFMSYAVAGHIQFRLVETDQGVDLSLRHQAFGLTEDAQREGVVPGWKCFVADTCRIAEGQQ